MSWCSVFDRAGTTEEGMVRGTGSEASVMGVRERQKAVEDCWGMEGDGRGEGVRVRVNFYYMY
jgi:hypothetical protein